MFKDTRERLSKRIGLKGKQFDKIKFAVVPRSIYGKISYLEKGMRHLLEIRHVDIINDRACADDILSAKASADDSLGIDHVNRNKGVGGKGDSIFIR